MSLVLFELLLDNCESAFLLLLEVLTRGAKGRENSQEDDGSKTADMGIFLVLVFFFLILNILSTGGVGHRQNQSSRCKRMSKTRNAFQPTWSNNLNFKILKSKFKFVRGK
jgi:hypothetical protein